MYNTVEQHEAWLAGGGLPTPYLVAGGIAVAGIIGIGLAGASPDRQSPTPPATQAASKSGGGNSSGGSKPSRGGKSSGTQEHHLLTCASETLLVKVSDRLEAKVAV